MFEPGCEPIWYALAQAPILSEPQWRSAVEHAYTSTDGHLLRLLFERPDRSEADRQWLLDTVWPFLFDQVLCSPVTTVEHAQRPLARRHEPQAPLGAADDRAIQKVAAGLSWNPHLGEDAQLLEFAVDLVGQLAPDDVVGIVVRWPGHHPAEPLLWGLLGRVVHLPAPWLNSWEKTVDEPVGGQFVHLWKLLQVLPAALQAEVAHRWLRLQAVLLEYGEDLEPAVLDACVPVLTDPNLGGPGPLSVAGRLTALRRWTDRHPGLASLAGPARRVAARDAARALADHELWEDLVEELVLFTTDPQVLASAVRQVIARVEMVAGLRGLPGASETRHMAHDVEGRGRSALASLARSPHTPDDVLLAVLPSAPSYTAQDLLEIRPHLSDGLRLEILARTGVYSYYRENAEPLAPVPGDEELAATGNPAGVLTGYLIQLPGVSRAQASRLAAQLLYSQYADTTVLAALPAEVVLKSAWHAGLAAQLLAEACGDDPARWTLAHEMSGRGLTYAGYLAQLREYTPIPPGTGLAGYRHCHDCQLISPHRWPDKDKSQRFPHERDGWMTCTLCHSNMPPTEPLAADTAEPCPDCATQIHYPAAAAVLQCPACRQQYTAPDLAEDLRPRLDAVVADQQRITSVVNTFGARIDEYLAEHHDLSPYDIPDGTGLAPLDPDGVPSTAWRERPARRFPGMFELTAPPEQWLSDDAPARQFRTALRTAFRHHDKQKPRKAALQHYGLGPGRRPVPVADIAHTAGVTIATARRWVRDCVGSVHANAAMPVLQPKSPGDRACIIVAHLADQTLGNLDPADPATSHQIAALITAALPGVDLDAGVRLLLYLAGWYNELDPAHTNALIRSVTHITRRQ
ncbi:hypothetical protein AB0J90_03445 [Micromonospora sp. NPDC049523]|uniref:hypothetical protein n=1 Tax=Micromonospora sp. NPDC049523 TaxID=3155921 RepID=UPI00341C5D5D